MQTHDMTLGATHTMRPPRTSLTPLEEDLLTLLKGREFYGLAMIVALAEACPEERRVRPSTLYPVLALLVRKGWLRTWQGDVLLDEPAHQYRRYYTTTLLGEQTLLATQRRRQRLASVEGPPSMPILMRLRQVL
jgi:PadR family transcriptional regulator PadR